MSADSRGNATASASGDELTPGEHLRAEIERLGLDQVAVSQATGVSRQSINNIVNGRQPISRAMAARLARLTGHGSDYWLRASYPRPGARRRARTVGDALRPLGVGILVNHQIARAVKDGIVEIDPFDESNVRPASIDLTLDDFIVTAAGKRIDITDGQGFALEMGHAIQGSTREWIALPRDYIGRVGPAPLLARGGIMTVHEMQIRPGFEGHLQFRVFNAGGSDFELRAGMAVIGLEIMPLSAVPRFDEKKTQSAGTGTRDKVVPLFRGDDCERMILDEIRRFAIVETTGSGAEARLPELNVEFSGGSAEAALNAVVRGALKGLKTLRDRPVAARADRDKYGAFFGALADRLHLSAQQARGALAGLGLHAGGDDTAIVTLGDGSEAMLQLPSGDACISLRHLARQLRENPADLVLMLTGLLEYRRDS